MFLYFNAIIEGIKIETSNNIKPKDPIATNVCRYWLCAFNLDLNAPSF